MVLSAFLRDSAENTNDKSIMQAYWFNEYLTLLRAFC